MKNENVSGYEQMLDEFGQDPRIVQTVVEVSGCVANPEEFIPGLINPQPHSTNGEIFIPEGTPISLGLNIPNTVTS